MNHRLHPAVVHHIVNTLEWPALRPLQEAAVAPLLAGEHALLLAPTAGGKTEAAVFPLLSRMLAEDWGGLSVPYVCLHSHAPAGVGASRLGFWRPSAR